MPFKDANKQRECAKEWARKQRKTANSGKKIELPQDFKLETARDLTLVIETVINEVLQAKMEAAVRGRCIAQLVQTAIKLLEAGEVEDRLTKLEARLDPATLSRSRG